MFDPFLLKALLAGIGVALMCGPLGCFVAWQRLAYFGDTIAHAALLGVAFSLLLELDHQWGIVAVALLLAAVVAVMERRKQLASDTLLGVAAHGALAIGVVLLSFSPAQVDIGGYLFGDILAVGDSDIIAIYLVMAGVLAALRYLWNDLLRVTVHADIATVEGINADRIKLVLMLLLALAVAISIKIVGMLLITALLIMPAASARYFSSTPTRMALIATLAGMVSVLLGLGASLYADTPSGPSIVVAALGLFLGSHVIARIYRR